MKKYFIAFILLAINVFAIDTLNLVSPQGGEVTILRDEFGVPHIFADNENDLFFGQGFATAQDRLVQLQQHRIYSAGETAEYSFMFSGTDYNELITQDRNFRIDKYSDDELRSQFDDMSIDMQNMILSYTAGINRYIDSMNTNPNKYMDYYYSMLKMYGIEIPEWDELSTMHIIVYMSRIFGAFGGYELDNYNAQKELGYEEWNARYPINDPEAFATLNYGTTGSIDVDYKYNDLNLKEEYAGILSERIQKQKDFRTANNLPNKFGSFAALISTGKSINGSSMLLGCPQMGVPESDEVTLLNEVELNCPTLHAGGASVTGIPGIIIGRTEDFAWTFTSGIMDNTDIVVEQLNDDNSQYFYKGEYHDFEKRVDTIKYVDGTSNEGMQEVEYLRTVHGPVVLIDEEKNKAFVYQFAFWQEEFRTWESLYNLLKSETEEEILDAVKECTISFNMFYTNQDKEIKYHFLGKYPIRPLIDPRLPRTGEETNEWSGFMAFDELPNGNDNDQSYYVNWNNKPATWWDQGDNLNWIADNNIDKGVRMIDSYVKPISQMTYQELKNIPHQISDHGTYQQAFEFLGEGLVVDENILPPGQSGFTDITATPSKHLDDQWEIFQNWKFKNMYFGDQDAVSVEYKQTTKKFVKLMPNPAVTSVKIIYTAEKSSKTIVSIYDAQGKFIAEIFNGNSYEGNNEYSWNIGSEISTGLYFYKIITNDEQFSGKILIK